MAVIGFIGSGNMGSAIINSIAKTKKHKILIYDINRELALQVANESNSMSVELETLLSDSDIIFLAVKPQILPSLYKDLKGRGKKWISIAAGVSLATLKKNLGSDQIVRLMPNIATEVGKSVTALCATGETDESFIKESIAIAESFGSVYLLDEKLFGAFVGSSASAIATVFAFINGLALGAVKEGLSYSQALNIVCSTTFGALKLLESSKAHPEELISKVCSPGGTTIESVTLLENSGFKGILIDSVSVASQRAQQLEEKANKENQ
ncbi:MAG: pyrroline-5-carboxylate reductase [Sphaerochaetaceae bacterium]